MNAGLRTTLFFILLLLRLSISAQIEGEWTWVSGSNTTGSAGTYGAQGVSASANQPGARIYPSTWADGSGNIWLFGGYGFDNAGTFGNLNDLWEYKPSTGQWTWVSGSNAANASGVYGTEGTAAAGNQPGARNSSSGWKDGSGNFWIYGGTSGDFFSGGAAFGDLWMFAPATGEWTWRLTGLHCRECVTGL